jgi:hypothetical protein
MDLTEEDPEDWIAAALFEQRFNQARQRQRRRRPQIQQSLPDSNNQEEEKEDHDVED